MNSYSRRLLDIVFLCYLHQLILKEKKMFENMQSTKQLQIFRVTVTLWISELTDFVIASVFSIFFWSLATSAWFLSYWVVSFCLLSLCLEYPLISFSTSLIFFSSSSIYQETIQIIKTFPSSSFFPPISYLITFCICWLIQIIIFPFDVLK